MPLAEKDDAVGRRGGGEREIVLGISTRIVVPYKRKKYRALRLHGLS